MHDGRYMNEIHLKRCNVERHLQPASSSQTNLHTPSQASAQRQIPRQRSSIIQILRIEVGSAEPVIRRFRIDERQITVQDPAPTTSNLVDAAVVEIRRPLLPDEVLVARVARGRVDGDHVDAFDVLGVGAEICPRKHGVVPVSSSLPPFSAKRRKEPGLGETREKKTYT